MSSAGGGVQGWTHHAVDLDAVTLHSRQLPGPFGGPSGPVFWGPWYRLSARAPYLASPEAWLIAGPVSVSTIDDTITWQPREHPGTGESGGLRVRFAVSPDVRSVVSFFLEGASWPGQTGHVQVSVASSTSTVRVPIPGNLRAAHTVELHFVPLGGRESEIVLFLEPGIRDLILHAVTFGPEPPVLEAGVA